MKVDRMRQYIDELINKSTPDQPIWNIEKIRQGKGASWNYIDGCMITAILGMYENTGDEKYLKFADEFTSFYIEEDGHIKFYDMEEYNLDNINAGKNLYKLYDLTGKEKYRKAIDVLYKQLQGQPRTASGNFWHKLIYPNQVWLDGLYMTQPFYMAYETRFNKMGNYMDIYRQFLNVEKNMKDAETGLYYHAFDESREMFWCDQVTGLSQNYWLRSLGWFAMALVDTLEEMDEQIFYEYRKLMSMFKDFVDSMIQYQDEETSMWYQVPDKGDREGNYLETSGSAMMSCAIMKAVRLGYLPERYWAYGAKGFEGIQKRYLKEKDGELSLGGICLVAGLGGKDRRDGSFEYYMSEPVVENEAKGVAPFLLAYTEWIRK